MTYNSNFTSLHKGLAPIFADQDRLNFGPQFRGDIRLSLPNGKYLEFNKVYSSSNAADAADFPNILGTVWTISGLEGWFNIAPPDMPYIERGFSDGAFDLDGRFGGRQVTLSGSILIESASRSDIDRLNFYARKQLIEAFDLVRRGAWLIVDEDDLITDAGYKRASFVRLADIPEIETVNSKGRIDFAIPLRAADPIKYEWVEDTGDFPSYEYITDNGYNIGTATAVSPTTESRIYATTLTDWDASSSDSTNDKIVRTYETNSLYSNDYSNNSQSFYTYSDVVSIDSQRFEGGISAYNHGNTPVGCYFRVIGPVYGPAEITNDNTKQTITILASDETGTAVVGGDKYLSIDTRTREVHLGDFVYGESDASARGLLAPLTDWITLEPGENVIYFTDFGAGGETPSLQVYWRSGWIG